MRLVCAAVVCLWTASCADSPKVESRASQPAPRTPARQEASLVGKPAAASADRFASEYEAVMQQIGRWDGDTAKIEDARTRVKAILSQDRNYAPAYVALARCETASGYQSGFSYDTAALDRASRFVNHALKIDPDNVDALCTAAWVARYRGDFDLSDDSLRRAEELKPGHPEVKLVRASLAMEQEDPHLMMRLAREVIAESNNLDLRAQAYRYLIRGYESGSHLDEADNAHREMLKLRPDSAWVHGNYAAFLLRRDDVDGAIREAEEAVRIRRYPNGVNTLVRSYIAKAQMLWDANRIADSATYIQKVAGLAGDDSDLSYALGQFYEGAAIRSRDASMRKKALESYRRTVQLNPRHIDAERAIGRLTK